MLKLSVSTLATLPLACALAACGSPAQSGDAIRPKSPTAAEARGSESVYVIEAEGEPLIVDWQPETRGDLEVAMHDGIAVVGFDQRGLRLLKDCHLPGKYGFVGVNTKEHVVRLESTDEVKANLPAAGLGIIAKLGAELGRSQVLDVAIVMVGKRRTTWATASKEELEGSCSGATHFVRGATIGAFAMRSGAKGQARTVAEVFGAGATASASGQKTVESADGLLDACKKSVPDAESPPPQCGALIRLELIRLGNGKSAEAKKDDGSKKEPTTDTVDRSAACPPGFVFSDGKCTRPSAETTHVCMIGDVRDCTIQCEKGNGESCDILGNMFFSGKDGVARNHVESYKLFDKACTAGVANGCLNLAVLVSNGFGTAKDPVRGLELLERACGDGSAKACHFAGETLFFGYGVPKDEPRAAKLTLQACKGGEKTACSSLGYYYSAGMAGLPKNSRLAAQLYGMACDGGAAIGCGNLAFMYETGEGVQKDEKRAFSLYQRACNADLGQCVWLGVAYHIGLGIPKDEKRAFQEIKKTCANAMARGNYETQGENASCVLMNEVKGEKNRLEPQALQNSMVGWSKACQAGTLRECTLLAIGALGVGNPDYKKLAQASCKAGERWACELVKLPRFR